MSILYYLLCSMWCVAMVVVYYSWIWMLQPQNNIMAIVVLKYVGVIQNKSNVVQIV